MGKYINKTFKIILLITILIIGVYYYGKYVGTSGITIKQFTIKDEHIPDSFDGVLIAHLSDIHYGFNKDQEDIIEIIDRVLTIEPDIIVFTGDLVDDPSLLTPDDITFLKEQLGRLKPKIGSYAVLGNHDYGHLSLNNTIEDIYDYSGINLLKNNYKYVYNGINESIKISGIDDALLGFPDVEKAMGDANDQEYTIFLIHEPDYANEVVKKDVDLIFAGHSHGGQIRLPFIGPLKRVSLAKQYTKEYHVIGDTELYISYGLGTTIMPIRLFNRPVINIYRLSNTN